MATVSIPSLAVALLLVVAGAEAEAQQRRPAPRPFVERGFITVGAGLQATAEDLSDRILFESNAETGRLDAEYPGRTGALVDGAAGLRVRGRLGIAVAASHATRTGRAQVTAEMPHPFFDSQPRIVNGDASDINRTETAVHGQLYYDMRPRGPWRVRLFAGPTYVSVEQEVVTGVDVDETYPFDTAEFRRATTATVKGSAIGFNAGLELARMLSARVGASGALRYARAGVDLDAPASRRVSTTGGGMEAAVGLRFLF